MKKVWIVALAMIVMLCAGCATRMGDLSVASTKIAKLDGVNLNQAPTQRRVTGEAKSFVILFIPLGIPHLEDAVDDALRKGGGDVMTDVTVRRKGWWFLVGEAGWEVTGDVVKTRGQGDAS